MSFRKSLHLIFLSLLIFLLLSSCKKTDPEGGEPLSIVEQLKLRAYAKIQATSLSWTDLMPEGFNPEPQPFIFNITSEDEEVAPPPAQEIPVVEELNGQEIRIAGYVVPLAGDEETITEFLLVPYFGACIHVPPPPANQIIYVKPKYPLLADESFDAIFVLGTLEAKHTTNQYVHVSYSMEEALLVPYKEEVASETG